MAESYEGWRERVYDAVMEFNDMGKADRSRYRDDFLADYDFDADEQSLFWEIYNDSQA